MEKKDTLTKILATVGTILVWLPILSPVLFSILLFGAERGFGFDYLMPAELFPVALAGSGLLLWAALRARSQVKLIAWGVGISILMLFGGQWIAVSSGLASGERQPTGLAWAIVIASLAVYSLGLILAGTGGALLLRELFRKRSPSANRGT